MYCYRFLGLSPPCTEADIKKAYRALALKYHPDKAGVGSEEKMKKLNEAYEQALSYVVKQPVNIEPDIYSTTPDCKEAVPGEEAFPDTEPAQVEPALKIDFTELTQDLERSLRGAFGSGAEGPADAFLDYIDHFGVCIDYIQPKRQRVKGSLGARVENEIHQHLCMLANDVNECIHELREWNVELEQQWEYLPASIGPRLGRILNLMKEMLVYDQEDWNVAQRIGNGKIHITMLHQTCPSDFCRKVMMGSTMTSELAHGFYEQQIKWTWRDVWQQGFDDAKIGMKYV